MKHVKFVVGIEDCVYMRWQLAILLESLNGKLPAGWELWVVICNELEPPSKELSLILDTYQTRWFPALDMPTRVNIDFAEGVERYYPLNRIEALSIAGEYLDDDDLICLIETDIFLYRDLVLDVFPQHNALFDNWIVRQELFFGYGAETVGVRLDKLLESIGSTKPFKPGGVTIFLDAPTARNKKLLQDCYRFAQVLILLGRIATVKQTWPAEMACFALALTANNIEYDLFDPPHFTTQNMRSPTICDGTFYHYYCDSRDRGGTGAFWGCPWSKHLYKEDNLLMYDPELLRAGARTEHQLYFADLIERARRRIYAL